MTSPAAEIDIDEGLVRSLLVSQHPDLAGRALAEAGSGWDNSLWRLGDDLLVRLPRRAVAVALTLNEQRWLPELAPRLPLPVPVPVRVGQPSPEFPWPWTVVPWLAGGPGDRSAVTDPPGAAGALGRFLAAMHVPAPGDAPQNPFRGVPLAARAGAVDQRLGELRAEVDLAAVRRAWDRAVGAEPWAGPPVWLHGDLHPANVLISAGTLAAVIDFGDICAGDPATDLAGAWMLLPEHAMPAFAAAYGTAGAGLEARTMGWLVLFGLMLLAIGLDPGPGGRPSYEAIGRAALDKAVRRSAS